MRIPAILAGAAALIALAPAAYAADLGTGQAWGAPDAYAAPSSTINWTGGYAGLHLGGGWGHASTANLSGFVFGAHGGYNFQFDRFVAGIEGDIDASGLSNDGFGTKYREKWLGSIRARLGYTFDRFLVFGTGGFAMGTGQFKDVANNISRNHAGFALGFGGEMKITNNLSARAEYLHYGLGTENYQSLSGPMRIDATANIVRGGLSYHF